MLLLCLYFLLAALLQTTLEAKTILETVFLAPEPPQSVGKAFHLKSTVVLDRCRRRARDARKIISSQNCELAWKPAVQHQARMRNSLVQSSFCDSGARAVMKSILSTQLARLAANSTDCLLLSVNDKQKSARFSG